ncbi:MAG TPA: divalent metal cation transporter [bacterium]|nr:divalent metal cation transporter [bacterium]
MGPGIVSGASDNDPAGIVTYIQIGATTGFGLLWLMALSTVMMYYLEEMSTRLGVVTKQGIARILRSHYGPAVALVVVVPLLVSNIISIGADLAGTGAALDLVTGIPWDRWILPIGLALGVTLVYASYRVVTRFLLLITPLFLLYVIEGFIVHPNWAAVVRDTLLPPVRFTPGYFAAALGLLGATLTPYIFFWQTTEEVEGRRTVRELAAEAADVAVGMTYSNLVCYFIILVAGVVLAGREAGISTAAEAAASLRPIAGPAAGTIFALAIVVSGIMAIPVMAACSAYALAETFGWVEGLDKKVWQARGFYVVLGGALAVGAAIALFRIPPVVLMFWSQVLNGWLLVPLFIVLLLLSSDRRVCRGHTNRTASLVVGWGTVLLTLALVLLSLEQLTTRAH